MLDEQRGLHLEKAIAIGSGLGQFVLRGRNTHERIAFRGHGNTYAHLKTNMDPPMWQVPNRRSTFQPHIGNLVNTNETPSGWGLFIPLVSGKLRDATMIDVSTC